MADLPNNYLDKYYTNKIKVTKEYLSKYYNLSDCEESDNDLPDNIAKKDYIFWRIKTYVKKEELILIIALPRTYPDTFPQIYISKNSYSRYHPIPHLNKNRLICTRDTNVVCLNDNRCQEGLRELIEIAIKNIKLGKSNKSQSEIISEFNAYWDDYANSKAYLIVRDCNKVKLFNMYRLGKKTIISESIENISDFLGDLSIQPKYRQKVYHILMNKTISEYPWNDDDLIKIIEYHMKISSKEIEEYFEECPNLAVFICSFPLNGDYVHFAWYYTIRNKLLNGFRRGMIPFNVLYPKIKTQKPNRIELKKLIKKEAGKRERVVNHRELGEFKVSIVGCGSLGSNLAMSIVESGINKLDLIDNEILSIKNIYRHLCDFDDVLGVRPKYKVDAVKDKLIQHNPKLNCNVKQDDVLTLIRNDINVFSDRDLIILAIGNLSVEKRISYLCKIGIIRSPLLLVWMEPYGVAGHALFIHPLSGGCLNCCIDADGYFVHSVARKRKNFYFIREAGCQSSYLPYSYQHVSNYINMILNKIIEILQNNYSSSYLWTWLGDKSTFIDKGYKMNFKWKYKKKYSIYEQRIKHRKGCLNC